MAREVIVRTWCDMCLDQDQHTEGEELPPLQLVSGKPRVVALCEVHRKELFDPLVELLGEYGQAVDDLGNPVPGKRGRYAKTTRPAVPAVASAESEACPDCGKVLKNHQTLQSHCREQHGQTLGQLLGEPADHACTEKDCDRTFTTPQGLAVHLSRKHGISAADRLG